MKLLKKIPFFLLLLVVFFCLHGSVENYGYLDPGEVLWVGILITLAVALLYSLCWLLTKNVLLASLVTFFISTWYLFFGAIHDLIKSAPVLHFLRSYLVLVPVLIVMNILVIRWLRRRRQLHPKLALYLNVLFLLFCLSDAVLLVNKQLHYKETVTNPVAFNKSKATQKPNVYFLLFDEYAGYKSLKDSFGFANDSLYNWLQQQRFQQLPTFSNYDFTPFSMSSVVNLDYVPENYNKQLLTQPDIQHRFGEIRNGQVFAIFKSMGYDILNYSIFDIKDRPALSRSNSLFPIHAALLTNKIFHNRLVKDIGWWFVTGRLQVPFLKKQLLYKDDDYNREVEQKLIRAAANKPDRPQFAYAHFFLPHGQYCRDSTGAFNKPGQVSDLYNKDLYLSYVKYTNTVIKKLVSHIVASDPGAIILVMSDHGFYDYLNPAGVDPLNFDNICFMRVPPSANSMVPLPRSNVNVFRYLFNSTYGQNLPYLNDRTVQVTEDPVILR